jgi:hypothetical protein
MASGIIACSGFSLKTELTVTAPYFRKIKAAFLFSYYTFSGFDWVLIAIGIVLDVSSHTGAGYRHRDRFRRG